MRGFSSEISKDGELGRGRRHYWCYPLVVMVLTSVLEIGVLSAAVAGSKEVGAYQESSLLRETRSPSSRPENVERNILNMLPHLQAAAAAGKDDNKSKRESAIGERTGKNLGLGPEGGQQRRDGGDAHHALNPHATSGNQGWGDVYPPYDPSSHIHQASSAGAAASDQYSVPSSSSSSVHHNPYDDVKPRRPKKDSYRVPYQNSDDHHHYGPPSPPPLIPGPSYALPLAGVGHEYGPPPIKDSYGPPSRPAHGYGPPHPHPQEPIVPDVVHKHLHHHIHKHKKPIVVVHHPHPLLLHIAKLFRAGKAYGKKTLDHLNKAFKSHHHHYKSRPWLQRPPKEVHHHHLHKHHHIHEQDYHAVPIGSSASSGSSGYHHRKSGYDNNGGQIAAIGGKLPHHSPVLEDGFQPIFLNQHSGPYPPPPPLPPIPTNHHNDGLDLLLAARRRRPLVSYATNYRQYDGRFDDTFWRHGGPPGGPLPYPLATGLDLPPHEEVYRRRRVEKTPHSVKISHEEKRVVQTPGGGHHVHHEKTFEHKQPGYKLLEESSKKIHSSAPAHQLGFHRVLPRHGGDDVEQQAAEIDSDFRRGETVEKLTDSSAIISNVSAETDKIRRNSTTTSSSAGTVLFPGNGFKPAENKVGNRNEKSPGPSSSSGRVAVIQPRGNNNKVNRDRKEQFEFATISPSDVSNNDNKEETTPKPPPGHFIHDGGQLGQGGHISADTTPSASSGRVFFEAIRPRARFVDGDSRQHQKSAGTRRMDVSTPMMFDVADDVDEETTSPSGSRIAAGSAFSRDLKKVLHPLAFIGKMQFA